MADRKATNKYYPPDFDPKIHGSVNKYRGSHALRDRARKLDSHGILVVRFEMPFNTWCLQCGEHIAKGRRFNAEKKSVGKYFSTTLLEFSFKCITCKNRLVICTDPKNSDYICESGLKRKNEDFVDDESTIDPSSSDLANQLTADPMKLLENRSIDKKVVSGDGPLIEELVDLRSRDKNDFFAVSLARKMLRDSKHADMQRMFAQQSKYPSLMIDLKGELNSRDDREDILLFRSRQRRKQYKKKKTP